MSLQSVTDPQVAALRALLHGGLNAELASETTEDVVASTLGWPASISGGRLVQGGLPVLAVWRLSDHEAQRTGRWRAETLATFRIDYILPATPLEQIDARWPLLHRVWKKALALICAGKHASVSDGAEVLKAAGFVQFVRDARYPTVNYGTPVADQGVYPSFQGLVQLVHRDAPDLSALPWFTELLATYDLYDGTSAPTVPAIVEDLERMSGYSAGFSSGLGAPDNG